MTFIGVDNGISGAIAAITPDGAVRLRSTPLRKIGTMSQIDEVALFEFLNQFEQARIVIEQGQKQPKFGCKGNFANGFNDAAIQTTVRLVQKFGVNPTKLAFQLVNPKQWQKDVFSGMRGTATSTKGASIEFCHRTFPGVSLLRTPRCREEDDNFADALCMAWWARNVAFR